MTSVLIPSAVLWMTRVQLFGLKTRFQFLSLFQVGPVTQQTVHAFRSLEAVEKLAESRGSLEARTLFLGSFPSLLFLGGRAREEQVVLVSM